MHALFSTKKVRQDYKAYLVVFLTAIGARIFFLVYIDESIFFSKYPFFAERLAQGIDIGDRLVDLSPFYLYFLAVLKQVLGADWWSVKLIQSFVGALNALLVFAVGSRAVGKQAGLLAAMIYGLYGNVIILETTLEPTVFALLFNLLCVYLLLRVKEASYDAGLRQYVLAALAGLLAGVSIITKPNFLLFLPIGAAWFFFGVNKSLRVQTRLSCVLFFCVSALLVVLPVTVRNYVKVNDFVLVTADAGKVFFHGNGRGATALEGTGLPDEGFAEEGQDEPDYAHVLFRRTAARMSGKELSPSESSRFWVRQTLDHIVGDPASYVKLEIKKLCYFFNDYEMHYIASTYKEYKASLSFPSIRYGIIASLGLLGMVLGVRRFRELFLVYGTVFIYLLSCMLFLVQSRYRTPAVPYLCLFSGYAIYALKEMIVDKRFRSATGALIIVVVFFGFTTFCCRGEIVNVDRWQRATKIHYQMGARPFFDKGRYEDAISELNKCLAMIPDFGPAYNLRGKSLAVLGKHEEALADFEKVMFLSPNLAEGYKNAGFILLLQGDEDTAKAYLFKALALAPGDEKVARTLESLKQP